MHVIDSFFGYRILGVPVLVWWTFAGLVITLHMYQNFKRKFAALPEVLQWSTYPTYRAARRKLRWCVFFTGFAFCNAILFCAVSSH